MLLLTCRRERRVEFSIRAVRVSSVRAEALAAVTGNTVVTTAVQDADTHHAELHVLMALSLLVEGREVGLVVAI